MTSARPKIAWSDLRGARVGIWGFGREGQASLRKLRSLGAEPVLVDDNPAAGTKFSPTGRRIAAISPSVGASGLPATSAASSASSAQSARSARRAASTAAARHSLTSPTHSNGLVPEPSRVRNFGASAGSLSGSPPPPSAANTARSSSAGMNGARMRSMKQHLSHCPHQCSSRRLLSR